MLREAQDIKVLNQPTTSLSLCNGQSTPALLILNSSDTGYVKTILDSTSETFAVKYLNLIENKLLRQMIWTVSKLMPYIYRYICIHMFMILIS